MYFFRCSVVVVGVEDTWLDYRYGFVFGFLVEEFWKCLGILGREFSGDGVGSERRSFLRGFLEIGLVEG